MDTHEHLIDESQRLSGVIDRLLPCDDWTYVLRDYVASDLVVAGMPAADLQGFFRPVFRPMQITNWSHLTGTAFATPVMLRLCGADDLTAESVARIAENTVRPSSPASTTASCED
ncbi:hypothetical protein QCM80_38790 [Bradyrhizobium sp. SSUT112]|uniref:hypothetical protein n=1 Tax=Bradyrhizobium sp. SSUT112 TaxID=3040604 RepID=UPI00244B0D04|nr:hypothetical protein [Bradyrhizobium sp. SSUT112]MDH2356530.1 hypothetical protein [Bradyrhizobium sp. SSUT112]